LSRQRSQAQTILDVMFECLSRCHEGTVPKDREDCMKWARRQLVQCGVDVYQRGSSHAVLREPVADHMNIT
jgi:hypothetical protein